MKADSFKIAKVFSGGGDVHYVLPYFQREYAWEKSNWQVLLNDVIDIYEAYDPENEPEHFLGSLVVINDGTRSGTVPAFKLVDGQQRLTTVSLIFCVLARLAEDLKPALKVKIQKFLINPEETGLLRYKLLPTKKYGDQEVYLALLDGQNELPPNDSKIPEAFSFLHKEIEGKIKREEIELEKLFIVLSNCLQVVFIDLNQEERPYEIFESLNAKGKDLSQADLVRNYIAMKLPENKQGDIFDKYWSKIENLLQEKRTVGRSRLGELTAFLRHYMGFRTGSLINERHVYARFRDRIEKEFKSPNAFEQEVATLKRFSEYYDKLLRPNKESNRNIQTALERLNTLEVSTAYPFLLAAYDAMSQDLISHSDFLAGLNVLENYIIRRYIVGEPTNYTNKMFPSLWREIDPNNFVLSLTKIIITKNYPTDHKVRQATISEQLYGRSESRAKLALILDSINRHLSDKEKSGGYTILNDEPTIEHIMPQTLGKEWKQELGESWEQTYSDYINTLGNLTLVTQEWNSGLSNSVYALKKKKLNEHALKLNSVYFKKITGDWNEKAIRTRAEWLASHIVEIWFLLGNPPVSSHTMSAKPTSLKILGQSFTVGSWRDVAYYTAKTISEISDDFDNLAEQYPAYFDTDQFKNASKQLPNGWWLNVNLSASSIKNFCRNLIESAGISEEEWQVEEAAE
jgi:uncharacterized protein with ParB-like and HNH nuclease domain